MISDCEGFEADLFGPAVAAHLARCHAIIEVHDHPHDDHPRMKKLLAAFSGTHDLRIVHSVELVDGKHDGGHAQQVDQQRVAASVDATSAAAASANAAVASQPPLIPGNP